MQRISIALTALISREQYRIEMFLKCCWNLKCLISSRRPPTHASQQGNELKQDTVAHSEKRDNILTARAIAICDLCSVGHLQFASHN